MLRRLKSLTSAVGGAIMGFLVIAALQSKFIYFPTRELHTTPDHLGLAYESVDLTTADGVKIHGWFVPAPDARATVLFFHGNAGNISDRLATLQIFQRLRVDTFIIDYRGFGQSEGSPSEEGTYHDAEAAWRYLVEERGVAPSQLVLFGRSLGGGVASWLAAEKPAGALVLESTFTSCDDMAASVFPFLPVRLLMRIHYDNLERVGQIDLPLLVVHSPEDDVVPFKLGRRVYEAANEPKRFVEIRGSHADGFYITGPAYVEALDEFLSAHL